MKENPAEVNARPPLLLRAPRGVRRLRGNRWGAMGGVGVECGGGGGAVGALRWGRHNHGCGLLWHCHQYGTAMALPSLWRCYGTAMALLWHSHHYGTAMASVIALLWHCYGTAITTALLWRCYGTAMALPAVMALLWHCYGYSTMMAVALLWHSQPSLWHCCGDSITMAVAQGWPWHSDGYGTAMALLWHCYGTMAMAQ